MYVCMYASMYVRTCTYIYTYTCMVVPLFAHIALRVHEDSVHAYIWNMHMRAYIHTYIHIYLHRYCSPPFRLHSPARVHVEYAHACIHTYIYTYIGIVVPLFAHIALRVHADSVDRGATTST